MSETPQATKGPRCRDRERVAPIGTRAMSIENTRPQEGNDDGRNGAQNDESTAETTPIGEHPLGDVIARNAPYAADHGDSL